MKVTFVNQLFNVVVHNRGVLLRQIQNIQLEMNRETNPLKKAVLGAGVEVMNTRMESAVWFETIIFGVARFFGCKLRIIPFVPPPLV